MNLSFPALAPGVHVYERNETSVQIGLDPATAIVVDAKLVRTLLPALTGTCEVSEVLAIAETADLDRKSVLSFLELLQSLTLLINVDPELTDRARDAVNDYQRHNLLRETKNSAKLIEQRSLTEIEIRGAGRLGSTICLLLASSGFPSIRIVDASPTTTSDLTPWGASRLDLGSRRDLVTMQILERITKGITSHNNYLRFKSDQKLVILVPDQVADFPWIDPLSADPLIADGIPHLFAASSTNESHISSVIVPGDVPCLRCRYYTLCDVDSAWPLISQQLSRRPAQDLASIDLIVRTALAVVDQVTAWADSPSQSKKDLQVISRHSLDPKMERTEFHPSCGCAWDRGISD